MKTDTILKSQTTYHYLFLAGIMAFTLATMASLPQLSHADRLTPPTVPANLQVPAGNKLFLKGHAVGTQNYICLPSGSGFVWTFFGPQATLFKNNGKQTHTHFLSPNPDENGTARATWQDSKDTSAVWARAIATSTDPQFVAPGAISWLLLEIVGAQDGPTGGDNLSSTTYIQRVSTAGGVAPSSGCVVLSDVGKRAFVPYTTDYYFYTDADNEADTND
jgi:hypothetical protein